MSMGSCILSRCATDVIGDHAGVRRAARRRRCPAPSPTTGRRRRSARRRRRRRRTRAAPPAPRRVPVGPVQERCSTSISSRSVARSSSVIIAEASSAGSRHASSRRAVTAELLAQVLRRRDGERRDARRRASSLRLNSPSWSPGLAPRGSHPRRPCARWVASARGFPDPSFRCAAPGFGLARGRRRAGGAATARGGLGGAPRLQALALLVRPLGRLRLRRMPSRRQSTPPRSSPRRRARSAVAVAREDPTRRSRSPSALTETSPAKRAFFLAPATPGSAFTRHARGVEQRSSFYRV